MSNVSSNTKDLEEGKSCSMAGCSSCQKDTTNFIAGGGLIAYAAYGYIANGEIYTSIIIFGAALLALGTYKRIKLMKKCA